MTMMERIEADPADEFDLVPLADAAATIGCDIFALRVAILRRGAFDPNGDKDRGVCAYELSGNRLAMHQRRLGAAPSVRTVQP